MLQEEDDAAVGHEPQLLVEAFGVAELALHADAGKTGAVQVGAICEPRVPSRLGAGTRLVHSCIQLEGFLEVVETDHLLIECVQFDAAPVAGEA